MSTAPEPDRPEIRCAADDGKAFSPALTPEQICAEFMRALGDQSDNVRVELRFSPRGLASARAARRRDGEWEDLPLFELAVMDRQFNVSDINQLAHDVLGGISPTTIIRGN
jgi:hypothetical protein